MSIEIERRFLVVADGWRAETRGSGRRIRQGYLASGAVAVRVRTDGVAACLAVKGPRRGLARLEFEYAVPPADAEKILKELCQGAIVEKTRFEIPASAGIWEIDEFHGENAGLVVAEMELAAPDAGLVLPAWAGPEITRDNRFANSSLAARPFRAWPRREQDIVLKLLRSNP